MTRAPDHAAPAIQTSRTDGVLVIEICNPPVNAASAAVRQGLVAALQTLQADADLQAGVLMGAGNTFVAGSDLREFGQPMQHPQLPAVIAAGIDPIWFGVYLILTVEMAQITPPIGFNLFVIQGITGRNLFELVRMAFPFFLLLVLATVLVTIFPQIVMVLPNAM